MEKITGHIATLRPDKCILADVPCLCVGSIQSKNGRCHKDMSVYYYADEVFASESKDGEKIFFIPIIPLNGVENPEKVVVPLFMLNFYQKQRTEIMNYANINGYEISIKDFHKPQIAVSLDPEYAPNIDEFEFEPRLN